jgi:hypothetical protein
VHRAAGARAARLVLLFALVATLLALAAAPASARPESTRTIKLRLLASYQQAFGSAPQLLVIGSSRSMRCDPEFLRTLLGVNGFNAGVGSGTPPDALAFLRIARATYPAQPMAVLYLLDIENMRLTGFSRFFESVPQLVASLPSNAPGVATYSGTPPTAASVRTYASYAAARDSGASLLQAAYSLYPAYADQHSHWASNGYLIWCIYDYERARGVTADSRLPFQLRRYRRVYPSDQPGGMSQDSRWYVREIVKEANEMGVTPVIALTPYHPKLLAMLKTRGWDYVHRRVMGYLSGLGADYKLRVLDFTSVKSFGGWGGGFYDGVHSRPAQMQRLLRVVAEQAGSDLTVSQPTPAPAPTPIDPPTEAPETETR